MTDINTFLDSHAALLASRELSFDEKAGYLTCRSYDPLYNGEGFNTLTDRTSTIRAAMIERQGAELKTKAAAATAFKLIPPAPPKEKRDIEKEIQTEQEKIRKLVSLIGSDFGGRVALENLQMHTRRLQALERKRK